MKNKITTLQNMNSAIADWDARKRSYPADKFRLFAEWSMQAAAAREYADHLAGIDWGDEAEKATLLAEAEAAADRYETILEEVLLSNTDDELPPHRELHSQLAATGIPFAGRKRVAVSQVANEIRVLVSTHFRSADIAKLMTERADLERRIQVYKAWLDDDDEQAEFQQYKEALKLHKEGKGPKPVKPVMPSKPKLDKQLPSEAALIRDTASLWRIITLPVVVRDKLMRVAELHHEDFTKAKVPRLRHTEADVSKDELKLLHLREVNDKRNLLYSAVPPAAETGELFFTIHAMQLLISM